MVAIPFEKGVAYLALTNMNIGQAGIFDSTFDSNFYAVSAYIAVANKDHTAGEGPLEVGLSHSDYTTAEIQEKLNATGNTRGDQIAQERRRRKVRSVGYLPGAEVSNEMNDGKPVRVGLKFVILQDDNLNVWVRNHGPTLTTGGDLQVTGVLYGRWM